VAFERLHSRVRNGGHGALDTGEHPSLAIGPLLETLALYYKLLEQVEGNSILLEEYACDLICTEEQHLGEVDKMLRKPGDIAKVGA
jgi:bacterioferritin